jgi:hypothetical protein
VSITNDATKPAVGCVFGNVSVAGPATLVTVPDVNFTVTGAQETRADLPRPGPETARPFHVTVTCDNGVSTSRDRTYSVMSPLLADTE